PTVLFSEKADPLPSPPKQVLSDPETQLALSHHSNFIKIQTPYNVDKLSTLLLLHPNRPFVESVLNGLKHGFWPCHSGEWKDKSEFFDNYPLQPPDEDALKLYRDKEVEAGRWSPPISKLSPGMKLSPMFVVWQGETNKARVVTDQSASGLNDGVSKEDAHVRYDDMHSFGAALRQAKLRHPGRKLILFKDDVKGAFPTLPAHPAWQLKQVVTVSSALHIVRVMVFGGRAIPRTWCAFASLILWILVRKLDIVGLHMYMDDFFGWDFDDNCAFFRGRLRPKRQIQLLIFWEYINCPYEDRKQDSGACLKIIGFFININIGSISITDSSVNDLVSRINSFLDHPQCKPILRDWLQLAGHINWAFNVLPWGRPALTELYAKVDNKLGMSAGVPLNVAIRESLSWLADILPKSIGVRFLDDGFWPDSDADMVLWTDASKIGLSFTFAGNGFWYQIASSPQGPIVDIFFLELVAILSAVSHVASLPSPPKKVLLWSDSLDSVQAFNSLSVRNPAHNAPLLAAAGIILQSGIDLRVRHIPGKDNIAADLLSRLLLDDFRRQFPAYRVRPFDPP
ncbi:hypothetical protein DFJ43DRAFT_968916, partial [Lentinula guzmanii]